MKNSRCALLLVGSLALVTGGCGDDGPAMAPVTGLVTYQGEPVAEASVVFNPDKGAPSSTFTDSAGKFKLIGPGGVEGVVVGPGTFTVLKMEKVEAPATDIEDPAERTRKMAEHRYLNPPKSLLPKKYGNLDQSDLNFTVAEGENNFTLELKD